MRIDHSRAKVLEAVTVGLGGVPDENLLNVFQGYGGSIRFSCGTYTARLCRIPFDQQREILYYVFDRVPRLTKAALDKTGNGAYLAEKATQRYGSRVIEVHFSQEWYRTEMAAYVEAFGDGTIELPAHPDILQDHQALQYVGGVIRIPEDHRFKGSDGLDRHGDSAIAGALMFFASRQDGVSYGYQAVSRDDDRRDADFDDDIGSRGGFRRHGGLW
ncbi:hypothetical protein PUH89_04120 [Rhodobacter capsulatus]|uniref:Uncharacterized protein n=1 Tax=Rhodobacter capsulatus TaxID=1061 RepID=A0A1G7SFB6_RHOCA|nr:hypothetical protein [Rhodobacter capsulatus]WER10188.1 hypothetical protein PUH89_04120 [Rhodobacter capsulatus]SDG21746.1 hypothetical protein SAMN04244550_03606 [Rhodobacter capsulatus]